MELTWNSRELRDLCEKRELALEKLGEQIAVELGVILADVDASGSFAEFLDVSGASREVVDHGATVSVTFDTGAVLTLESGHPAGANVPPWDKVTRCRVKLLELPT